MKLYLRRRHIVWGLGILSLLGFRWLWPQHKKKNEEHGMASTPDEKAILQIFPIGAQWPTLDPFLFCAYHKDHYPPGNGQFGPKASLEGRNLGMDFDPTLSFRMYHGEKVPGFPSHPHRGFETVTVVTKGLVDHADSMGAAGRYGNGDVQWMTAGRGLEHSEMFPLLDQTRDNMFELFQIWLNLPKKNKMTEPHFKMLWSESVPIIEQVNTSIRLIAGSWDGATPDSPPPASWAHDPQNKVRIWEITLKAHTSWTLPSEVPGLSSALYFFEGDHLIAEGQKLPAMTGMLLHSGRLLRLDNPTDRPARLLLLSGRPIAEPIAKHGPFVMNDREGLIQAFEDYNKGLFGDWRWERKDMVHGPEKTRFALYPDGKKEVKG